MQRCQVIMCLYKDCKLWLGYSNTRSRTYGVLMNFLVNR